MTTFTPSNNSAANNSATRTSVNEPSHKTAFEHLRSVLLRGGRITKFKGIAASIAPMVGAVVAPVLMAGAISVGGAGSAWAGTCTETGGAGSGIWTCAGPAGADVVQNPTPAAGGALTVTTNPGFGITTAAFEGVRMVGLGATNTDVSFTDTNMSTISGATGVFINGLHTGNIDVDVNGTITGTALYGVFAENINDANTGNITIRSDAAVNGVQYALFARNDGSGFVDIVSNGNVSATTNTGIGAFNGPSTNPVAGDITVLATGTVLGQRRGIAAVNFRASDTFITTTNDVIGISDEGILARAQGTANNLTINASGTTTGGTIGISGENAGTTGFVDITTSGIVTGLAGYGIFGNVSNAASTGDVIINVNGGAVTGIGAIAHAVYGRNAGLGDVTIASIGDITTSGDSAYGLHANITNAASTGTTSTIMNGGSITTAGNSTRGHESLNAGLGDATATMNGGDISTAGSSSHGLLSFITNTASTGTAMVLMSGGVIDTTGDLSRGLQAQTNGLGDATATMTDGDITTAGLNSRGVWSHVFNAASTGTATATMNGGTITTLGTSSPGLYALNRGLGAAVISATGGTVAASGADAHGASAVSFGGNTEVTIDTSVMGGSGLGYAVNTETALDQMSTILINDNAVISAASGLAIQNNEGDSATTVAAGAQVAGEINLGDGDDALTFNGTDIANITLFNGGDDTLLADTFIDTLNFNGVTGTTLGANVTNWEEVHIGAGSTISFTDGLLSAGDITEPTTGLYVDAGGILDQGGIGLDLMGNMFNTGIITTQDGTAGDTIMVSGNYTGGGQLLVDTVLGDDTSASDTLVIEGDVSGMTDVFVANVGGTGAQTTTGILVVDVNGASPADGFALANGVPLGTGENGLIAGAYGYAWRQIGSDWYLQSTLSPTDDTTLFNPAAPIYEAYPQTLLGMMTTPTMQQRVGNRYWKEAGPAPVQQTVYCKDPAMNFECAVNNEQADYYADKAKEQARMDDGAIWARVEAAHNHVEPTTSTTGASFDQDQWRLQAGIDGLAHESEKGDRLFVGINGSYGTASSQISSAFDSGSIDTTAYSLGATATWLATNGIYVDLQGSYAWFDSDLSSDIADIGSLADGNDGTGYALSAEFGKKIDVHNNWTFTPQVQLSYAAVDFDSFTGPSGEAVSLGDADSLKLRLGISADRDTSWTDDNGMKQRSHLYAIANVIHDFSPETTVLVSGTPLTSERDAWTGEVGLGFTRNFNDDKYAVYGEVNAATGLENFGDSYKLGGTLGVRVSF